jgi:hypothetical protein
MFFVNYFRANNFLFQALQPEEGGSLGIKQLLSSQK